MRDVEIHFNTLKDVERELLTALKDVTTKLSADGIKLDGVADCLRQAQTAIDKAGDRVWMHRILFPGEDRVPSEEEE